jgi:hypothetical protein
LFASMGVVAASTALLITPFRGKALLELDYPGGVAVVAIVAVGMTLAVFLGRRAVLNTVANRRIVSLPFVAVAGIMLNRLLSWSENASFAHAVSLDLLICACVMTVGAIAVDRRVGWGALVFALGVLTTYLFPAWFLQIFVTSSVGAFAVVAAAWLLRGDTAADNDGTKAPPGSKR